MKFGLMFFASSEEALSGNKYRLVTESARFADGNGFSSVWVPERHFTEFGSLYPNPAVLHAALAAATTRIRLNAGSVVTPLHHPIRIAEEWSMVDNLSGGRVGISFAPGWNPDDFAFCPDKYASRREGMLADIETVRHLWRGGAIDSVSGNGGAMRLRIYPTPVQRELPVWLTAAGNPNTFIRAGEMGANLLTHVLDQDEEQLARKIALYREARAKNGHDPAAATVTVMLHTFVGCDAAVVREQARAPFCDYVRRNIGLLDGLAQSRGQKVDVRSMPAHELDRFVLFLYERFAQSRGLIGTPESCLPLVKKLEAMGVDEVACLLDFGPPVDLILENLPHLLRLRELARPQATAAAVRFNPAAVQSRCTERIAGTSFNESLRNYGIQIDGAFHSVREIWRRPGEALAKVGFPEDTGTAKFALHPAFLDGCGRVLAAAIDRQPSALEGFYLPSGVGELKLHGKPSGAEVWSHAVLRKADSAEALIGDVRIYDEAGSLLIEIEALRLQRVDRSERAEDFREFLYRRVWKPLPAMESVLAGEPGDWLILSDRAGVGKRLVRRLEAVGQTCALIPAGSADDVRLLNARSWKGVVQLRGLDLAAGDIDAGSQATAGVLEIVHALAPGTALPRPKLWIVTAGAMPVLENESPTVAQSPLWGLGQAIAVEHPPMWGGLIDLDPGDLSESAIADAILDSRREGMIALRSGQTYVARMVRDDRTFGSAAPLRFQPDATYAIAGGTGGLGRRLAVWLEERGAGNIVLLGRTASGPRAMRCDVSRRSQVAEAFRQIERSMPPLKGIFHLAGILDDAMLVHQDAERFHRAAAAKIEGAWNLHECSAPLALDHFVMFSSMASLVTMPGQGNYASANGFLDALAHLRRSQGKPSLSVNWGPWAEIGHAETDYGRPAHQRLADMGIDPLAPDLALAVLGFLMERGVTQTAVARVNWACLFEADPAAASPLLSEFLQPGAPAAADTELLREVKRCRPDERREFVICTLAAMLADALRLPDAAEIARDRSLFDLGLDSILAMELTSRISTGFGHPFRATLFFTDPTLATVADHILREVAPPEESAELSEDELSELIAKEIGRT